jgi:hypothetical protein
MKLSGRWVAGAAAVAVPLLATAGPAAAATAFDSDSVGPFTFTATGGGTVQCAFYGEHSVDTDSGELSAAAVLQGGPLCRGRMSIALSYVDDHRDLSRADTAAVDATGVQNLFVYDAGSTAVTGDFSIEFQGCASNCVHNLQTKTK